jgi:hypothetical protein
MPHRYPPSSLPCLPASAYPCSTSSLQGNRHVSGIAMATSRKLARPPPAPKSTTKPTATKPAVSKAPIPKAAAPTSAAHGPGISKSEAMHRPERPATRSSHQQSEAQTLELRPPITATADLATSTDQAGAISQTQGMELVQTFVYSSISAVLNMRQVLPKQHFQPMYYASINRHCSYEDFTSGVQEKIPRDGDRRPPGNVMNVLRRNTLGPGDQIIKWLVSWLSVQFYWIRVKHE